MKYISQSILTVSVIVSRLLVLPSHPDHVPPEGRVPIKELADQLRADSGQGPFACSGNGGFGGLNDLAAQNPHPQPVRECDSH